MTKWFVLFSVLALSGLCLAQSESATLSGRVSDPSGAAIVGAEVVLTNTQTNVEQRTKTNGVGLYVFPGVHPGTYRVAAGATGFRVLIKQGLTLHVQDELAENFSLTVGAISESITVTADATPINTTDASVSTVVDRQFAENLPLNGRSFQTLIQLTPGVVAATTTGYDYGQFSVNGQRATANYWTIDGASANIGTSPLAAPAQGLAGSVGGFSLMGGTNSLVSVDALQEFRLQTSSYAPEFGRTPGGQISIITRSGTNQFHGTLFDYLRNDALDANDWFANNAGLPKPEERQNDFGGTFSGPILKNRTFFFISYEGLRLRLPQVAQVTVPDMSARQNAIPAIRPLLNAFPQPNGLDDPATGIAEFHASYSNSSTLDAYSLRLDHRVGSSLNIFGRYNYSPSQLDQPGYGGYVSPSSDLNESLTTHTATVGADWAISPTIADDFRFNYSRVEGSSGNRLTTFGGAVVPAISSLLPNSVNPESSFFSFTIFSIGAGGLYQGKNAHNLQRQLNWIDNLSVQKGMHSLKFGLDYRRLFPVFDPQTYDQILGFLDVPSAESGNLFYVVTASFRNTALVFQDLGVFGQDTWRIRPKLTLTYGLRWDVEFSPSSTAGPKLVAVTGFRNPSALAIAPSGTPVFSTKYGNVAPRLGLAYRIIDKAGQETVLRGGVGMFYDTATQEVGSGLAGYYPFAGYSFAFFVPFPPTPAQIAPSPISLSNASLFALDPDLKLPYTVEWNLAVERALGPARSFSLTYTGAVGRRLIATESLSAPNANISSATLVTNAGRSDYHAFQAQFRQRLSHGLESLVSYTWGHSIDDGSASSAGTVSNVYSPAFGSRGPSDFDIRHSVSAGVTYQLPGLRSTGVSCALLCGWSLQTVVQARSAPPVNVDYQSLSYPGQSVDVRPDVVPGVPVYLHGPQSQYPGGKAFNPAAFTTPPIDPNTQQVLRQGDVGRNALRGFGAAQWDFAVHRDFPIREGIKLQFRCEMFNVLNHPNFGNPIGNLNNTSQFGRSTQMLGRSLDQSSGGAGFNALYQIGGPRSVQAALKVFF